MIRELITALVLELRDVAIDDILVEIFKNAETIHPKRFELF
jgi:hypothetical protein